MVLILSVTISSILSLHIQSNASIKSRSVLVMSKNRSFFDCHIKPSSKSIALGIASSVAAVTYHPILVNANGQEALDLLTGYKTHTDDNLTWFVLLAGSYAVSYKIFKWMASW